MRSINKVLLINAVSMHASVVYLMRGIENNFKMPQIINTVK